MVIFRPDLSGQRNTKAEPINIPGEGPRWLSIWEMGLRRLNFTNRWVTWLPYFSSTQKGEPSGKPGRSAEQQMPEITERGVMMHGGIHRGYCQGAAQSSLRGSQAHTQLPETPLVPAVFFWLHYTSQREAEVVAHPSLSTFSSHWQKCKGLSQQGLPLLLPLPAPPPWASFDQPVAALSLPQELNLWWEARSHILLKRGLDAPFSIRGSASWNS